MGKKRKQAEHLQPPGPAPEPAPASIEPSAAPAAVAPAEAVARRDFLTHAGTALLGIAGLGSFAVSVRFALPAGASAPEQQFAIGTPGEFHVGTLTWLRDRELFVLRDPGGFGAISSRCTHLGCTVRRTADGFACPCHGARFDARGAVLSGPARRGLRWLALWSASDGRIWVDVGREVSPGTAPLASAEERRG